MNSEERALRNDQWKVWHSEKWAAKNEIQTVRRDKWAVSSEEWEGKCKHWVAKYKQWVMNWEVRNEERAVRSERLEVSRREYWKVKSNECEMWEERGYLQRVRLLLLLGITSLLRQSLFFSAQLLYCHRTKFLLRKVHGPTGTRNRHYQRDHVELNTRALTTSAI